VHFYFITLLELYTIYIYIPAFLFHYASRIIYYLYFHTCISIPFLFRILNAPFVIQGNFFFICYKLPFVAVYNRFSLHTNVQEVVFLLEVLNPRVIFVVVIFILQDYKKIEAFKPPLLLLEDFFLSPSRPSS
jgi:hypothetical protein